MPIPTISALSERIANTHPLDSKTNLETLKALKAMRLEMHDLHSAAALEGLDGAILMLSFHLRTDGMGGPELMDVLGRIVHYVHHCMLQEAEAASTKGAVKLGNAREMDPVAVVGDMQLGEILFSMGYINEDEIHRGLSHGRDYGIPFGEALLQTKAVGENQMREALCYQEACRRTAVERSGASQRDGAQFAAPDHARAAGPRVIKMSQSEGLQQGLGLKLMTDVMLGEVLIRNGHIDQKQLEDGLLCQRVTGARLGEALVASGACDWEQVEAALEFQSKLRGR